MRIYLAVLLYTGLWGVINSRFAYERGRCDIAISSVITDLIHNEKLALVDRSLRYSKRKRIQYDLYTPRNPNHRQILKSDDPNSILQSNFNADWPVRFSIHGWTGKSTSCSNAAIKDAYLAVGNFNVIVVDWSAHAFDINYGRVSQQLPAIAKTFVKFVKFLHSVTGVSYSSIYLIGHSAGAHFSGLAGKWLRPQRFGAIFALDPAGLTQLHLPESQRLTPSDAPYVESIHSDITLLGNPGTRLSHASFWANWGRGQTHCPNRTAAEFDISCDHFASIYYFAESVRNSKLYGAVKCQTKASNVLNIPELRCKCRNGNSKQCLADIFMGGEPAVPKRGIFYFSTRERSPYGYGKTVHIRPVRPTTIYQNPSRLPSLFKYNSPKYNRKLF